MNLDRVYLLTPAANDLSATLRLHPIEWQTLGMISHNALISGTQLAVELQVTPGGASTILTRLQELNLIREPEMTLNEYEAHIRSHATAKEVAAQEPRGEVGTTILSTDIPEEAVADSHESGEELPGLESVEPQTLTEVEPASEESQAHPPEEAHAEVEHEVIEKAHPVQGETEPKADVIQPPNYPDYSSLSVTAPGQEISRDAIGKMTKPIAKAEPVIEPAPSIPEPVKEPEPSVKLEAAPEPLPLVPEIVKESEPVTLLEPVAKVEPVPEPVPLVPEPVEEPEPIAKIEPVPEPPPLAPEPIKEPEPIAKIEPAPEPPPLAPEPVKEPEPIAKIEPAPEPPPLAPEPIQEPEPIAKIDPIPEPPPLAPEPVMEPEPIAKIEPVPEPPPLAPEPIKEPEPIAEVTPAPEPPPLIPEPAAEPEPIAPEEPIPEPPLVPEPFVEPEPVAEIEPTPVSPPPAPVELEHPHEPVIKIDSLSGDHPVVTLEYRAPAKMSSPEVPAIPVPIPTAAEKKPEMAASIPIETAPAAASPATLEPIPAPPETPGAKSVVRVEAVPSKEQKKGGLMDLLFGRKTKAIPDPMTEPAPEKAPSQSVIPLSPTPILISRPETAPVPLSEPKPEAAPPPPPPRPGSPILPLSQTSSLPPIPASALLPTVPPTSALPRMAPPAMPPSSKKRTAPLPIPKVRSYPIQPVITFVRNSSSSPMAGYMSVYKMFLSLPQQLVEHSAWNFVDLQNTPIQTENDNLALAFVQAAEKVVGRPVPAELKVR